MWNKIEEVAIKQDRIKDKSLNLDSTNNSIKKIKNKIINISLVEK